MASQITHDVVATIGEYTDRETGLVKKRYHTCGKCFTDNEGRQSIKLDAIPAGPGWTGWLSLYPVDKKDARQAPAPRPPPAAPAVVDDDDDDIPF